jgi:hypothetical protein
VEKVADDALVSQDVLVPRLVARNLIGLALSLSLFNVGLLISLV